MIKLGISGICGRMGLRILALAQADKAFNVAVGLEDNHHPSLGQVVSGVKVAADLNDLVKCDCLIDFTSAAATMNNLAAALKFKKAIVIGTTGLSEEDKTKIKEVAKNIPIVFSPNMSIGVNVLFRLVKEAASKLTDYKINIVEAHHVHKKDSPSGTAKRLAEVSGRRDIPIESIREGEIIGDHRVIFESDVDKIELFHSAKTRDIFAKGALAAAKFAVTKKSGLFDMQDVLGQ